MTYIIVLLAYVAILFAVAWTSRRSLGVPTLVLASGALLADLWTDSLTPVVAQAGLVVTKPPLTSIVAVAITLAPALLVMFRAHKTRSHKHSLVGSLIFAILAAMLTYSAFSGAVVLDAASQQYATQITQYRAIIITVCVVLALLETVVIRHNKPHAKELKK